MLRKALDDAERLGLVQRNAAAVARPPVAHRTEQQTFGRQARLSQLPAIRLHDLRHTFATLALKEGVHPKIVSERPGHATVGITLDLYSHVTPAIAREAADTVGNLILGPRGRP